MVKRLLLLVALIPLQSCSNTLIGERLESSFDNIDNTIDIRKTTKAKEQNKTKVMRKIKSSKIDDNKSMKGNIPKETTISNKDRFNQQSNKSKKKVIFNPQPYRIILKLSGTNPSAPAETLTNALIQAGIQFEVEKIERFEDEMLTNDPSLQRKGF